MSIIVEAKGFEKLAKTLKNTQAIRTNTLTAIRNSVNVITQAMKHNVPRGATGDLSKSIASEVDERNLVGRVGLDYPGKNYGKYVEKGTGPHWAPIRALERWAEQRGISPYAIQRSIAQKGTRPHPFFWPAYERNKDFIKKQFSKALKYIVKDIGHGQ